MNYSTLEDFWLFIISDTLIAIPALHRERDPLLLQIHGQHSYFNHISDVHDLQRVSDKAVCHAGDVNEAVLMYSNIDKSSVFDKTTDLAIYDIARFYIFLRNQAVTFAVLR